MSPNEDWRAEATELVNDQVEADIRRLIVGRRYSGGLSNGDVYEVVIEDLDAVVARMEVTWDA